MNRKATVNRQRGVTLIELLVGSAIGLFLLFGAVTLYVDTVRGSSDNLSMTHLDQQLRSAMSVMTRELRRAGAVNAVDSEKSPVVDYELIMNSKGTTFPNIVLGGNCDVNGGSNECDCILFSYDLDKDRLQGVGSCSGSCAPGTDDDNDERFGLRVKNGALQMRHKNDNGGVHQCADHVDDQIDTWVDITDGSIQIGDPGLKLDSDPSTPSPQTYQGLRFKVETTKSVPVTKDGTNTNINVCETGNACLERRQISIKINGLLTGDTAVQQSLEQIVKVRNDRYIASY